MNKAVPECVYRLADSLDAYINVSGIPGHIAAGVDRFSETIVVQYPHPHRIERCYALRFYNWLMVISSEGAEAWRFTKVQVSGPVHRVSVTMDNKGLVVIPLKEKQRRERKTA